MAASGPSQRGSCSWSPLGFSGPEGSSLRCAAPVWMAHQRIRAPGVQSMIATNVVTNKLHVLLFTIPLTMGSLGDFRQGR